MSEFILEANELSKTYKISDDNKITVLKSVDVQIGKGEFVSVMGPSGSGKSTLLYLLSGMENATSGWVMLNDQKITDLSEEDLSSLRLTKMGFIFQQIHLLKNLSIFDNIILPAYMAKIRSKDETNKRARELMERTGIAHLEENDINQASGGQLQRVAICRALINNPEIIFGDEPTGALNSRSAEEIMTLLDNINKQGTTILLVTHDVKVAVKTEKVLYMIDGNLVAEYTMGKLNEGHNNIAEREEQLRDWLKKLNF